MNRTAEIVSFEKESAPRSGAQLRSRQRVGNERSLPFGWVGKSAALAAASGVPIKKVLWNAGIGKPGECIADEDSVSPAQYMFMGVAIINLVDDEMHSAARTRMPRGTVSTGLRIMASARCLRTAIEALRKFYALLGIRLKLDLVTSGPVSRLEVCADVSDRRLRATIEEMVVISLHCEISFLINRLLPVLGMTTHSDHPFCNHVHPYLRCKVACGTSSALIFPTSCLDLQPVARIGDNPVTDAVLYWLKELSSQALPGLDTETLQPLSKAVFDRLLNCDVSYGECCHHLGMQGDELRRALTAEGTGYRQLRQSALLERLRPHLLSGAKTDDIAIDMGFSDARSLRRSLRSASGLSLAELKESIDLADIGDDPSLILQLRYQLDAME